MKTPAAKIIKRSDLQPHDSYEATYCPEDNKIRLYVGRVPREEYDYLRAEGWVSTPKQSEAGQGEFAAVWTPARQATALHYAGFIGDEDTPPTERAADRAERFSSYRDKRADEATGHADNYDSQPSAHGFQSERKAERAAARHDRQGDKATDQWSKAEYWQRRTAGVIEHALHKSSPGVRMGRIKTLEAELRKLEASHADYTKRYATWQKLAELEDTPENTQRIRNFAGTTTGSEYVKHPRPDTVKNSHILANGTSLWSLMGMVESGYGSDNITGKEACAMWLAAHSDPETLNRPWAKHLELRLAYENQMLEAQGGRAGAVEMIPGGWLLVGSRGRESEARQIHKVNKSPVTGRVVSVLVQDNHASRTNHWGNEYPDGIARVLSHTIEIERAGPDCYRAPTDEELAAFNAKQKAAKKAKKENGPAPIPLINPTDEDAERLQDLWNEKAKECGWYQRNGGKPSTVLRMTQAQYSANSGGSYAGASTLTICEHGTKHETRSGDTISRHSVFKIRATSNGYSADRVIVITDKPQKKIPWDAVKEARAKEPTIDSLRPRFDELNALLKGRNGWLPDSKTAEYKLMQDARYVGIWFISSMSQFGWTEKGKAIYESAQQTAEKQELQAA